MFESLYADIQHHALDEYPCECCGLVADGQYITRNNVHPKPDQAFKISGQAFAWVAKKNTVEAVVHSHTNGMDCPSSADMAQQIEMRLPWVIVTTDGQDCSKPFVFGDQTPIPALIGRGFRHGVTDCYTLIRDWYRLQRGITLKDYPRDYNWWTHGQNLYLDGVKAAGFKRIDDRDLRTGDVFFAQIRSKVPCHGGIYLGKGLILHHPNGCYAVEPQNLSRREPVARWRNLITHWYRYAG